MDTAAKSKVVCEGRLLFQCRFALSAITAVCAAIYGLSVSIGNQFSTDYSAAVSPILMISTAYDMGDG